MVYVTKKNTGEANITGPGSTYDATGGNWSFTIDNPLGNEAPTFAFNFISTRASPSNRTPDGGMTLALLGMALMGVEGARRRFIK